MNQTKLFTPKEANKTLPLVKRIVQDILRAGQRIRNISLEERASAKGGSASGGEADPEVTRYVDQLDTLFEELEAIGCSYKDWNFSEGLVDFPSKVHGREVFLCWRSDEDEIKYYHDLESGFAGRKQIPEEYL